MAIACAPIACSAISGLDRYQTCADCSAADAISPIDATGLTEASESGAVDRTAPDSPVASEDSASNDGAVVVDVRDGGADGGGTLDAGQDASDGATGDDGGARSDGDSGNPVGGDANDGGGVSLGLVALYAFNETSGTTTADTSGNGHTATLVGGATFASGLQNNAVTMDGSNQYVSLPNGIVSGLTSFSISAWVKLSAATQWSRIFDFGTGTSTYMFLTPNAGNMKLRFSITTGGSGQEEQISAPALPTSSWQHVVVTLAANTGTVYVNGVQAGQNTNMTLNVASLGNTRQNWLGRSEYSVDPYLNGQCDNFRIYNRALSAADVQTLYAGNL